jgi:hypothetical protein
MTTLVWDVVGERRFETGLDRGVLFTRDGSSVAWNGLTEITEKLTREMKSYFIDGIKYLDHPVAGAYGATMKAYTYPDELEPMVGNMAFLPGVVLHDQPMKTFHLSYRTRLGNDLLGVDYAYKLHILYNIMAVPADSTLGTIGEQASAQEFQWELRGTPPTMYGARPTSHISFDSRLLSEARLAFVEEMIYGSDSQDPALLEMVDLLDELEDLG